MDKIKFEKKIKELRSTYDQFVSRSNLILDSKNGIINRYRHPVLTNEHIPPEWRYDFKFEENPFLMERLGVNTVCNSGAIKWQDKYILIPRIEGADRKSFFAIAESPNGVDNFTFWDYPVVIPSGDDPETNSYDMRLVAHEDGWIYGLYCAERLDPQAAAGDLSSAIAQCGIVRTKDFKEWQRLPDLKTQSPQQRNCVLHPEFVHGKYAFYTRPQDGFINAGTGGGIGWGLCDSIENPLIENEIIVDDRQYHTIKEVKNGQGPAPLKTNKGWLHLAHGVRNTAAGLRYVLYMFMTALQEPWKKIYNPGGLFMGPEAEERIGDVSNVLFSNGWILDDNGDVYIYYASADTRLHVAKSTIAQLVDYCMYTPKDAGDSAACVKQRIELIRQNYEIIGK